MDLSQCILQVEASAEDLKSVHNVFETFLTSIVGSTEETQSALCERNMGHISREENVLPFVTNVLLMPSPLIKINTNCIDEKNDLHKLLQFTPREGKVSEISGNISQVFFYQSDFNSLVFVVLAVTHKSLFSRYMRDNRKVPELRMNLFVSRINIDDAISLGSNEKQSMSMRFVTPKRNQLYKKTTTKYSRLFSTYVNKTAKGL